MLNDVIRSRIISQPSSLSIFYSGFYGRELHAYCFELFSGRLRFYPSFFAIYQHVGELAYNLDALYYIPPSCNLLFFGVINIHKLTTPKGEGAYLALGPDFAVLEDICLEKA